MEGAKQTPHIVILPSPGMGHLIPLVEFAKHFIRDHDFSITFTIPTDGPPTKFQKEVVASLPKCIDTIFLPPVNHEDLSMDGRIETHIYLMIARSLPSLHEVFKVLTATTPIAALLVDLLGTDAFDVAKEFKVPSYIFFPSTAMGLSLYLHLPELDEKYTCEYRDIPERVKLPGCVPIHGRDLVTSIQDRQDKVYTWTLHHAKRFKLANGILLNSFMGMEGGAIKALKEGGDPSVPPIYPIGPLIQNGYLNNDGLDVSGCLRWLKNQPVGSVLFVSFGTGGALSREQLNELALGLELSKQRFLWVVKSPNATYFDAQSTEDTLDFMPEGFLERTKGRGLVVPSWAPQIQVLSHASTGGFLTHCGWNSTLESVVHGVPLIAWPLYAEQKMNAVMLVEDLKVALKAKATENEIIGREEIAMVVKCLMEGEEGKGIRKRMSILKDMAAKVLSEQGNSGKSISAVARKWESKVGDVRTKVTKYDV